MGANPAPDEAHNCSKAAPRRNSPSRAGNAAGLDSFAGSQQEATSALPVQRGISPVAFSFQVPPSARPSQILREVSNFHRSTSRKANVSQGVYPVCLDLAAQPDALSQLLAENATLRENFVAFDWPDTKFEKRIRLMKIYRSLETIPENDTL